MVWLEEDDKKSLEFEILQETLFEVLLASNSLEGSGFCSTGDDLEELVDKAMHRKTKD